MEKKSFNILSVIKTLLSLLLVCSMLATHAVSAFADTNTYNLITDIVYAYKFDQVGEHGNVKQKLAELKAYDARLGETWEGIIDYWDYVNFQMTINTGVIPDGMPNDGSMCIVILGFQLSVDGKMMPELEDRCRVGLEMAKKYPNAPVIVSGNGSAQSGNSTKEADVMADWLVNNGLSNERIFKEDESQTTIQNAKFTVEKLRTEFPKVTDIAIVTSDYHIQLGCLLFRSAALLSAYENGGTALRIITNSACEEGIDTLTEKYTQPRYQGEDIWRLAAPQ